MGFLTGKTHAFREYTTQEFCLDPSFRLLTFRRWSEDLTGSVCLHERAPTRRSFQAACKRSLLTDTGDVGASTSSLTVVAKSFRTHHDLTSFPGRTSSSLIQKYSCTSFIFVIFRSSPALTRSAGSPSIKAPSQLERIAKSAFGQSSS